MAQDMTKTAEQKYSRWRPHASKPGKFSILTNSSSLKRILWTSFAELRMCLKQMWQPLKNTRTNWTQPLNKRKTKTAKFKSNIVNLKSRIFNLPPFKKKKIEKIDVILFYFFIFPNNSGLFPNWSVSSNKTSNRSVSCPVLFFLFPFQLNRQNSTISLVFEILASILATNHNPYLFKN